MCGMPPLAFCHSGTGGVVKGRFSWHFGEGDDSFGECRFWLQEFSVRLARFPGQEPLDSSLVLLLLLPFARNADRGRKDRQGTFKSVQPCRSATGFLRRLLCFRWA